MLDSQDARSSSHQHTTASSDMHSTLSCSFTRVSVNLERRVSWVQPQAAHWPETPADRACEHFGWSEES